MNEKLEMIFRRRSVRSFLDVPLTGEQLANIQKAARMAPSAMNEQPWFFVIIQRKDIIRQIEELDEPAGSCHGAPALIVCFARRDAAAPAADTTFAMANIIYACEAMDLSTCIIWFVRRVFNHPAYSGLSAALGVPDGYFCVGAVAAGKSDIEKKEAEGRKEDIFSLVLQENEL